MATRLDKIMKPIIKEKCDKAFAKGYKMGFEAGGKNMALAYENEINSLKYSLGRERFLVKGNGEIIPLGPQWISVKDRLPDESGLYITFGCTAVPVRWLHNFDKDIGKFGAWWNYEPDGKEHPRYRFIEAGNITHWMPLPEPPKE